MTGDHSATLYVNRPLTNVGDIATWAKAQGFSSILAPDDMHVTIVFSKEPFNWQKFQPLQNNLIVPADSEKRSIEQFGDATVLTFSAPQLAARHQFFEDKGASFDFPSYTPHLTISYDGAPEDLSFVEPYPGQLEFGPEEFSEIIDDWQDGLEEETLKRILKMDPAPEDVHVPVIMGSKKPKKKPRMEEIQSDPQATVIKVDESLGIVFGWAITSNIDGEPHFDSQGDHIPESVMLKAASSFMNDLRVGREMHVGDQKGTIVFAWPMTDDIAKAMGIESTMTGLMIGFKPDNVALLQKYRDGDYTGFSIGGKAARYEVVEGED